jgi:hypothetical protein
VLTATEVTANRAEKNMKKPGRGLLVAILAVFLLSPLPSLAQVHKTQTLKQQLHMTSRQFFGGVYLAGDTNSFSGTLEADNPKCILTIPITFPGGFGQGNGPNGSIVLQGSSECSGIFELFLGNATGIGSNTGLFSGSFVIVKSPDTVPMRFQTLGTTVEWAGTYTQVYNIDPNAGPEGFCGSLNFCANLGPQFGNETFNGSGLSYLLYLNAFTFSGPNQ